jgi:NAD-dependent dihydropyrimidine dehydrogenase PreA subunit
MPYIITEACIGTKDKACVDVCPVDCIYEAEDQLYIHPDECIDCGACEPECPTTAIFEESELPAKWAVYKEINAVVSGAKSAGDSSLPADLKARIEGTWPNITEQKSPLPGADESAKEDNKLSQLDLSGGA